MYVRLIERALSNVADFYRRGLRRIKRIPSAKTTDQYVTNLTNDDNIPIYLYIYGRKDTYSSRVNAIRIYMLEWK